MVALNTLKDPVRERHLIRSRAIAAGVIATLLMLALAARLAYLQLYSYSHYTTLSHNNRVDIVPLAPTRGLIYDRNGVVLAENVPSFSLEIVPERVEDLDATIRALSELVEISESDIQSFHDHRKRKRRFEGVPLRLRLDEDEVARVAVNRHRLPGVEVRSRLARHYPLGDLTAHVVGYVGRINERELRRLDASNYSATSHIGKVGVEKAYEDLLHGEVGYEQVETNARGRVLRVLERTPPVPGKDLHLNFDIHLQRAAQEAFGEERGALVAIEPDTGAVLAMVSVPSYDPNLFVNGIGRDRYRALSGSRDRPLFNRAIRGQYPPGSTIKPFIGLAGLELGQVTPHETTFCPGWYKLKEEGRRYRCWKERGHGHTDLEDAIVQSCDVYFYDLARNLGIDRLSEYMQIFGFGSRTGIDVVGESPGLMPSRQWKRKAHHQPWFPGETLITGIGQGFVLATPLQLAASTAALAVDGRRMEPRLLNAHEDPMTGKRSPIEPVPAEAVPVARRDHWDRVHEAMRKVIHGLRGTARRLGRGIDYTFAGKTGTAQVFGLGEEEEYEEEEISKRLRDHALFIAFAPAEAPEIAVAAVVENGGSGGRVAGPIARRVIDEYMRRNPTRTADASGDDHG